MKLDKNRIKDFFERLEQIKEEVKEQNIVISFPEIKLTKEQMEVMDDNFFNWEKGHTQEYYTNKIQGQVLQSISDYVTREDQPDFQYLVDLGVKALKQGMEL